MGGSPTLQQSLERLQSLFVRVELSPRMDFHTLRIATYLIAARQQH